MNQVLTATVENGLRKPDEPLSLPSGTRVRLVLESSWDPSATGPEAPDADAWTPERKAAWDALEKLLDESPVNSGLRLTRDQLHDRG